MKKVLIMLSLLLGTAAVDQPDVFVPFTMLTPNTQVI